MYNQTVRCIPAVSVYCFRCVTVLCVFVGSEETSEPQPVTPLLVGYDKEWLRLSPHSLRYWVSSTLTLN